MAEGGVFPAITASISGKQRRLTMSRQWRNAIENGQIERTTPVHYETGEGTGMMKAAGDCPELAVLFDEIKGPLVPDDPEPESVELEIPDPADQTALDDRLAKLEAEIAVLPSSEGSSHSLDLRKDKPAVPASSNLSRTSPPSPSTAKGHGIQPLTPAEWAMMPFKRYADFEGRSSRSEFWYYQLVVQLGLGLLSVLAVASESTLLIIFLTLVSLATFVPSLAVAVRRLHDREMTGWLLLGVLIPFLNYLVFIGLLVVMALPGTSGANRFGANPLDQA